MPRSAATKCAELSRHGDAHRLGRYLTERIAAHEGITAMETAPIVRTVKRAGAPLFR